MKRELPDIGGTFKVDKGVYRIQGSQNQCTFLGVPIIRSIVVWGLDWGPPI